MFFRRHQNSTWPLLLLLLLSGAFATQADFAGAADAILVRPAAWKPAVQAYRAYRESQGLTIVEVDSDGGRDAIQSAIAAEYASNREQLRFVFLLGDFAAPQETSVPPHYRESHAMVQFGGDPVIATDNPYGDMNADEIPDLAVGRLPADSPQELAAALARVMQYESNQDFSQWRRNVHVVAGVGGFGAVADSVIEMTTRRFLADRVPGWCELSMTQASVGSHYCPDPWRFSESTIARMNQGGMFWVYIGHGHVKTLDYIKAENEYLPILTSDQLPAINVGARPPIAVFLACYTGAFDALEDSLAERLVLQERGPIAAIAASRVSGPYGLSMLADGMLDQFYERKIGTLGEVLLSAKRRMLSELAPSDDASGPNNSPAASNTQMQMISSIAQALSPADYDLRQERQEHVWQMHLLGDPMLRLAHPTQLDLAAPASAEPGETVAVAGTLLADSQLTIELGYRRDSVRRELNEIDGDLQTLAGRESHQQRYLQANDRMLVSHQGAVVAGNFSQNLTIPHDLPRGKYCIRVFSEAQSGWQVGYHEISIRNPKPEQP